MKIFFHGRGQGGLLSGERSRQELQKGCAAPAPLSCLALGADGAPTATQSHTVKLTFNFIPRSQYE